MELFLYAEIIYFIVKKKYVFSKISKFVKMSFVTNAKKKYLKSFLIRIIILILEYIAMKNAIKTIILYLI